MAFFDAGFDVRFLAEVLTVLDLDFFAGVFLAAAFFVFCGLCLELGRAADEADLLFEPVCFDPPGSDPFSAILPTVEPKTPPTRAPSGPATKAPRTTPVAPPVKVLRWVFEESTTVSLRDCFGFMDLFPAFFLPVAGCSSH